MTPLEHYIRVDGANSRRVMKSIGTLADSTRDFDDLMASVMRSPSVFKARVLQYLLTGGVMDNEPVGNFYGRAR